MCLLPTPDYNIHRVMWSGTLSYFEPSASNACVELNCLPLKPVFLLIIWHDMVTF